MTADRMIMDRAPTLSPGDIVQWQCPRFPHVVHRWKVFGVHYGAMGQESLIEMESLTHQPGWTGEWEHHPRIWVPEPLLRYGVTVEMSALGDTPCP